MSETADGGVPEIQVVGSNTGRRSYNIAMICDFFFPQLGGVEFHVFHLAQNLIELGHNVVIITHSYKDRVGVRYLTNGLKVYYCPLFVLYRETTFPSVFSMVPIIRHILIREQIDIVHSHGSASAMAQESITHANALGMKTVFTDHSLYGFSVLGSILLNKLLLFTLGNVDGVICVSNICKENMMVRCDMDPEKLYVIPNAVINRDFKPSDSDIIARRNKERITIVLISRLFPNKGADLLCRIIPTICDQHPDVDFLLAGDGPKFVELQQTVESCRLQDRVKMLGAVPHEKIRDVLCQGDIYLHASLTEAFGTVLVEAASCGLLIVTTKVGGIPEVLPEHMTVYAEETSVSCITEATNKGISLFRSGAIDTSTFHDEVAEMYDWMDVAERTTHVYDKIFDEASPDDKDWFKMMKNVYYRDDGIWARHLFVLCAIVEYLIMNVLEFLQPAAKIEKPPKWPRKIVKKAVRQRGSQLPP
ncbi:phosphatidylinositol N-acetylglucosaminyltransferase SPT14 KNAG_0J01900 [Huiozyma naganishii CBS 8797]|uniref:Phosphatidylinositol N-acetylglucosaminyltransferase GPI3 subunit n=1 Tax=Huiozyma naganishii (strain ATCC MYA-139 / BCRC 22969 / CBS 8797 / KCTC 17520 / NBRC 10181 / NCYC 3082 / Yp74L-3) TaxID=1071383 RepID=J7SAL2_HUIN7|nr:hypothetical protein KNAG_0J01900 [Kazachstania naganishii CBS 8797]CCK72271.1 hypothetical protein KNAG_0J01900 [Kazachstania naganishii CBS 8797]